MSENPFDNQSEVNHLEVLVGEGKKFKSVEDLAKGKAEADAYIEQLKEALAAEKAKTANGINAEAILAEIKKLNESKPDDGSQPPATTVQTEHSTPNVEELVLQTLRKAEAERATQTNLQKSIAKMKEVWGDDANKELKKTADTLGVSTQYLEEVAKQSSSVFFQLTGLNQDRSVPSGTTMPTSTVRPVTSTGQVRDAKYYRELKKSNPAAFKETKMLVQMEKDAHALGEAFFN